MNKGSQKKPIDPEEVDEQEQAPSGSSEQVKDSQEKVLQRGDSQSVVNP